MTENQIETLVCDMFGITTDQLQIKTRKRAIVVPRQICMMLLMDKLNYSSKGAASVYSLKNHATALHAKNTINNLMLTDQLLNYKVSTLRYLIPNTPKKDVTVPKEIDLLNLCVNHDKPIINERKCISCSF